MAISYCSQCGSEVEDTGGFCLLGHSLHMADTGSLADLRAEVDKAFEQARAQVVDLGRARPYPSPSSSEGSAFRRSHRCGPRVRFSCVTRRPHRFLRSRSSDGLGTRQRTSLETSLRAVLPSGHE